MNEKNKKFTPHIIAIVLFFAIAIVYLKPLTEGLRLKQSDIFNHVGASKEIVDYRDKTGDEPLWTNSMFGGMPAYLISVQNKSNLLIKINSFFRSALPHPVGVVFLYMLGFFR